MQDWLGVTLMFRWTGAALAAAIMALPLMVRAMRLSIEGIDRRLEGAARTLGAGRWHAFRTVSLPLALPGVLAALVLGEPFTALVVLGLVLIVGGVLTVELGSERAQRDEEAA